MKTLKLFMIAAVAVISIAGCKKNTDQPASEKLCKLTGVVHNKNNSGFETKVYIDYDKAGSIIKTTVSSTTDFMLVATFVYTTDKITIQYSGSRNSEGILVLVNGRVTKNKEGSFYDEEYTYNEEGYLIQVKKSNGEVKTMTYTGGNLTKVVTINGEYKRIADYEYSSELANRAVLSYLSIYNFPTSKYYGKVSRNLVTKRTITDNYSGTIPYLVTNSISLRSISTYTYTKDSAGNFNTETETTEMFDSQGKLSDTEVSRANFSYDCN